MTVAELQNWFAIARPGDRITYATRPESQRGGGRSPAKTVHRLYEAGEVAMLVEHTGVGLVRLVAVKL